MLRSPLIAVIAGMAVLWSLPARAQTPRPYEFMYTVMGDHNVVPVINDKGRETQFPLDGSPLQRGRCIVLYAGWLGNLPADGPDILLRDATYMARHLDKCRRDLEF